MNRNHFFLIGMVFLMLGIQVHIVDSYIMSQKATQITSKILKEDAASNAESATLFLPASGPTYVDQKEITPPEWLGWLFMSIGVVLILHSFAMAKPG